MPIPVAITLALLLLAIILFASEKLPVDVIGIILVTAFRHTSPLSAAAVGLILGGALGNLTDRAIRGEGFGGRVVDFIDLHVWPIFNLADTAIVVGAVILALGSFLDGRRTHPEPPDAR